LDLSGSIDFKSVNILKKGKANELPLESPKHSNNKEEKKNQALIQIDLIKKLKICFGYHVKDKEQQELINKKSKLLKHLEEEEFTLKETLES